MNKMWLVFEREYLERVRKKSFIIATIITPLIFPLIGGIAYILSSVDDTKEKVIYVVDESSLFKDGFEISDYSIENVGHTIDSTKALVAAGKIYGTLHIPKLDIHDLKGISFYAKSSPGLPFLEKFKKPIKERIRGIKMEELNIDQEMMDKLRTPFDIATYNISRSGKSKKSSAAIASAVGYVMAFLIYIFIFVYGSFIMQSVLNEKTSKVVEVIVSSIKPFHLMLGKVLANGAIAITQFIIWTILMSSFYFIAIAVFDYTPEPAAQQELVNQAMETGPGQTPEFVQNTLDAISSLPLGLMAILFIFYFLGGFLLYGALFAAVGSAVDSLQEAQQFNLPISLPIIMSIFLMSVVLANPHGTASVIITLLPITSPVLMMARIPFGMPPLWQLAVSMLLLTAGVFFTLWFAGRIYRVGILMHGTKVNYKVLAKWFMMGR